MKNLVEEYIKPPAWEGKSEITLFWAGPTKMFPESCELVSDEGTGFTKRVSFLT